MDVRVLVSQTTLVEELREAVESLGCEYEDLANACLDESPQSYW
jgi:hypothetical protein